MSEQSIVLCELLKQKNIQSKAVLEAIRKIPREKFIEDELQEHAYEDTPLPIGYKQTISQPYIVARMTELLLEGCQPKKVLEIGTGSGYQAAVLAALVNEVYSIERIRDLYEKTKKRLSSLGLANIHLSLDDGQKGWPEHAPYDGIIITAATSSIPDNLFTQLNKGGCLIAPLNKENETVLIRIKKEEQGVSLEEFEKVLFVPLLSGIE